MYLGEVLTKMRPKLCMGLIIIFICMAATTATVLAAPHLSWYTQALDYDETNALIIQGYLENDGTVVIDRVNLLTLNILNKKILIGGLPIREIGRTFPSIYNQVTLTS